MRIGVRFVQPLMPRVRCAGGRRRADFSSSAPAGADTPPRRPTLASTLGYFAAGATALTLSAAAFGGVYQWKADERDWPFLLSLAPGHFVSVRPGRSLSGTSADPLASASLSFFAPGNISSYTRGDVRGTRNIDDLSRKAHVVVRGSGAPLVVLETSTGGLTQDFAKCVDEIAKFTTVFVYDRHGLGFSSEQNEFTETSSSTIVPRARNARRLCIELNDVLNCTPPLQHFKDKANSVIVVGHGQGGAIAMDLASSCAAMRSDKLAGVVLLESVCGVREKQKDVSKEIAAAIDSMVEGALSVASLSKFGVARLMMNTQKTIDDLSLSYRPQDCSVVQALASRTRHCEGTAAEVACYADDDAALTALIHSCKDSGETVANGDEGPGGFRALVVSHGDADMFRELAKLGGVPSETAQSRLDTLEDIWQSGQLDLAGTLSRNAVHVQAKGCTHNMPQRHPEVVVEAVRAMVDAVRGNSEAPLREFRSKYHDERGSRGTTSYYQSNKS
eukprot:g2313.t1